MVSITERNKLFEKIDLSLSPNVQVLKLENMVKACVIFFILTNYLINSGNAQVPGLESPLREFLVRLSGSEVRAIPIKFSRVSEIDKRFEGFFRSEGKLGISSTFDDSHATERRWIWNPGYAAQLERVNQGDWKFVNVIDSNSEAYERLLKNGNHTGFFFGGGMSDRFQFLELVNETRQSDGLVCTYRYVPACPLYSSDPELNSLSIRFDADLRLVEIRFCDKAGQVKVPSVTRFEYPEDALFPLKRIASGVIVGGPMDGKKLESEELVEIDSEAQFDSRECFLSYYGLPEPTFPSEGIRFYRATTWIVAVCFIVLCVIYLRKNLA